MSQQAGLYSWAYDHSDNAHPKYSTKTHALYISISGTILFTLITFILRFTYFSEIPFGPYPLRQQAPYVGIFYLFYLVVMIGTRFYQNGPVALYEALWACNQCLLISGISLIIGDSFTIRAILIVVSVDQFLWYIDILSFLIKRKFVIGVAKYIIWPQTSKLRLTTTFHHLWFLPLCFWEISTTVPMESFTLGTFFFSYLLTIALAIVGRISVPKEVKVDNNKKQKEDQPIKKTVYMNINLSRELWKDVKIPFLDSLYGVVPSKLIVFVLTFFWAIGNIFGFLLFLGIQSLL